MKLFPATISTALLLVGLAALPYLQQARAQSEAGWIVLFDGKSLDNWNQIAMPTGSSMTVLSLPTRATAF
jgi:hypothetical protein